MAVNTGRWRRRTLHLEALETRRVLAAPTAIDDTLVVDEGALATLLSDGNSSLVANDVDVDPGDVLQIEIVPVVPPEHGTLILSSDGTFSYLHDGSENFVDSFQYRVVDSSGLTDVGQVDIAIAPINDNVPFADANGPYVLIFGDDLVVDGSGSNDNDLDAVLTYRWDLNLDGASDFDTSDPIATIPWPLVELAGLGLGNHVIRLTVDDGFFTTDSDASLQILSQLEFSGVDDGIPENLLIRRNGDDVELINSDFGTLLAAGPLATLHSIVVAGSSDETTLVVDFSNGDPRPLFGISFDGGTGGTDSLSLVGAAIGGVEHRFAGTSAGSITLDGILLNYSAIEQIDDLLGADDRRFVFPGTDSDVVDVTTLLGPESRLTSGANTPVTFISPTGLLVIDLGPGDDALVASFSNLNPLVTVSLLGGVGADFFQIPATSPMTTTEIDGGEGSDLFLIGSPSDTLDGLQGAITIRGGIHDAGTHPTETISVKGRDLTQTLTIGDVVIFSDQADGDANTYLLSPTLFERTGAGLVTLETIETISLSTSIGPSSITVEGTPDNSTTTIVTQGADDVISVASTGIDSSLRVETHGGGDQVVVLSTGNNSLTRLITGAGDDTMLVTTTGDASGLEAAAGIGSDIVGVAANGGNSNVLLLADAGRDVIRLTATAAGSLTELFAGEDSDIIELGADTGTLDELQGQICLFGEDHEIEFHPVESVTAKGRVISRTQTIGDTLTFLDQLDTDNNSYTLTGGTFARNGIPTVIFETVETLTLLAGTGSNIVSVDNTQDDSTTFLVTQGGDDTINIATTGVNSLARVDTGAGGDRVNVASTGENSITRVDTGSDDDDLGLGTQGLASGVVFIGGVGADTIDIFSTAPASNVVVSGDGGRDDFHISSTSATSFTEIFGGADNDLIELGAVSKTLDGLLGEICIRGEANELDAAPTETITAKTRDITQTLLIGDTLLFSDELDGDANAYIMSEGSIGRTGLPVVLFESIETVLLFAGIGAASVEVLDTPDASTTTIVTQAAADSLRITSSGDESVLVIETGAAPDQITIDGTGRASVMRVDAGADADVLTLLSSGVDSGVELTAGSGSDNVTIQSVGPASNLVAFGDADSDTIRIAATALASLTEVHSGAGSDTIELGAPANSLGGLLGEVCLFGDSHDGLTHPPATIRAKDRDISRTLEIGDQLLLRDLTAVNDLAYTFTNSTFARTGMAEVTFETIETIALDTTSGASSVDVNSTPANSTLSILTHDGNDRITIATTGIGSVLTVATGAGADQITVTNTGPTSIVRIDAGNAEDAVVINDTGLSSGLEAIGGAGSDDMDVSSIGTDSNLVVRGGADQDRIRITETSIGSLTDLFGGTGNDQFELGGVVNSLAGLLGEICLFGEVHDGGLHPVETIRAKTRDISRTLAIGDQLTFLDAAEIVDVTYALSTTTFNRTGMAPVTFETIETVELNTSGGANSVDITGTLDNSTTTIRTQDANDTITLATTGMGSVLKLTTSGGADQIAVTGTGSSSIVRMDAGNQDDGVEINGTGFGSGLEAFGSAGNDNILVSLIGSNSNLVVRGGADQDRIGITATAIGSLTDLFGGAGNDQFELGGVVNSLAGILGEICLFGDDHNGGVHPPETVSAKDREITRTLVTGDQIAFLDAAESLGISYSLTTTTLNRTGAAPVTFETVETIDLNTTSGPSTVDIISTLNDSTTTILTQDANDIINIAATGTGSLLKLATGGGADQITVTNTGSSSIVRIDAGDDDDAIVISATGFASGLEAIGGAGSDDIHVATIGADSNLVVRGGVGQDRIGITATAIGSLANLFGGAGNDQFELGRVTNSLAALQGEICLFGEDHDGGLHPAETVRAKGRDITRTLAVGDQVAFLDSTANLTVAYFLSATTLDRTGMATVTFESVETMGLNATSGANSVDISSTVENSTTTITTQNANDTITIASSGTGSVLKLATGGGADQITVTNTGPSSIVRIDAGDEADAMAINNTGTGSGLDTLGGAGSDNVQVSAIGSDSNLVVRGGADQDLVRVTATAIGSFTDILGGTGSDQFELGAVANSLAGLQGEICLFGEDHDSGLHVPETVRAKDRDITRTLVIGDRVSFLDNAANLAIVYSLSTTALRRTGMAPVTFESIETIGLNTTNGESSVAVSGTRQNSTTTISTHDASDTINVATTGVGSVVRLLTQGGSDQVAVGNTGNDGITQIDTGANADSVTLANSGENSGVAINAGLDNDVVTLQGVGVNGNLVVRGDGGQDAIRLTATATGSLSDIVGGSGTDTIELGAGTNSLNGILGPICVFGEDHDAGVVSLTVRGVTHSLSSGDQLFLNDTATTTDGLVHTLAAASYLRTGVAPVTYETIETVVLQTGLGDDQINVTSTAAFVNTQIQSGAGADMLRLLETGADSNVTIESQAGDDQIELDTTGVDSFVVVRGGDGADQVQIDNVAGDGVDVGSAGSHLLVEGEVGSDIIRLESSQVGSMVHLRGGGNTADFANDTIEIGRESKRLDLLRGTLLVDGDDHRPDDLHGVRSGLFTEPTLPYTIGDGLVEAPSVQMPRGDSLLIYDTNDTANRRFVVTSQSLLRDTARIDYLDIEQLELNTGTGNDLFELFLPEVAESALPTVMTFRGGAGGNEILIDGTDSSDTLVIGPSPTPAMQSRAMLEIDSIPCLHFVGRGGDDVFRNDTNALGLIEGNAGNDLLIGGSAADVLFGGDGIDALFGSAGNDFLFSDLDILGNRSSVPGELIDGGMEDSAIPGDRAAQSGVDFVRNVEALVDGGANKDVLTWLRAQILGNSPEVTEQLRQQSLQMLRDEGCNVRTERSSLPRPLDDITAPLSGESVEFNDTILAAYDIDGDGYISPLDAIRVINQLGASTSAGVETIDVDADGQTSPLDVILVINHLGRSVLARSAAARAPLASAAVQHPKAVMVGANSATMSPPGDHVLRMNHPRRNILIRRSPMANGVISADNSVVESRYAQRVDAIWAE